MVSSPYVLDLYLTDQSELGAELKRHAYVRQKHSSLAKNEVGGEPSHLDSKYHMIQQEQNGEIPEVRSSLGSQQPNYRKGAVMPSRRAFSSISGSRMNSLNNSQIGTYPKFIRTTKCGKVSQPQTGPATSFAIPEPKDECFLYHSRAPETQIGIDLELHSSSWCPSEIASSLADQNHVEDKHKITIPSKQGELDKIDVNTGPDALGTREAQGMNAKSHIGSKVLRGQASMHTINSPEYFSLSVYQDKVKKKELEKETGSFISPDLSLSPEIILGQSANFESGPVESRPQFSDSVTDNSTPSSRLTTSFSSLYHSYLREQALVGGSTKEIRTRDKFEIFDMAVMARFPSLRRGAVMEPGKPLSKSNDEQGESQALPKIEECETEIFPRKKLINYPSIMNRKQRRIIARNLRAIHSEQNIKGGNVQHDGNVTENGSICPSNSEVTLKSPSRDIEEGSDNISLPEAPQQAVTSSSSSTSLADPSNLVLTTSKADIGRSSSLSKDEDLVKDLHSFAYASMTFESTAGNSDPFCDSTGVSKPRVSYATPPLSVSTNFASCEGSSRIEASSSIYTTSNIARSCSPLSMDNGIIDIEGLASNLDAKFSGEDVYGIDESPFTPTEPTPSQIDQEPVPVNYYRERLIKATWPGTSSVVRPLHGLTPRARQAVTSLRENIRERRDHQQQTSAPRKASPSIDANSIRTISDLPDQNCNKESTGNSVKEDLQTIESFRKSDAIILSLSNVVRRSIKKLASPSELGHIDTVICETQPRRLLRKLAARSAK